MPCVFQHFLSAHWLLPVLVLNRCCTRCNIRAPNPAEPELSVERDPSRIPLLGARLRQRHPGRGRRARLGRSRSVVAALHCSNARQSSCSGTARPRPQSADFPPLRVRASSHESGVRAHRAGDPRRAGRRNSHRFDEFGALMSARAPARFRLQAPWRSDLVH